MHIFVRDAACIAVHHLSRFRSLSGRTGMAAATMALLLAMSPPSWAHDFKAGDIEIKHPWSRATPAGAKVAAGYVALRNTGSVADRLVSAEGEIAGRTEIHEMAVDGNGVMTMRPLRDGVEIPAGGEVKLEPGSFHIMFMDLNHGAKEGEMFKGTLTFEKTGTVSVEFAVEAMGGGAGHAEHGG